MKSPLFGPMAALVITLTMGCQQSTGGGTTAGLASLLADSTWVYTSTGGSTQTYNFKSDTTYTMVFSGGSKFHGNWSINSARVIHLKTFMDNTNTSWYETDDITLSDDGKSITWQTSTIHNVFYRQ